MFRCLTVHIFTSFQRAECVIQDGKHYRTDRVVVTGTEHECPVFSTIRGIMIDANSEVYLIVESLTTVKFYRHIHSYEVEYNSYPSLFAVPLDSLADAQCMSFHSYSHTQSQYISPRYNVVH